MLGLITIILGLAYLMITIPQKLVIPMVFMNYQLPIYLDVVIATPIEVGNGNLDITF